MQDKKALDIVRAARYKAAEVLWPWAADGLYALHFRSKPGIGTLATDKFWRVYYDPATVTERWTVDEVAGVLLHELDHLRRMHFERAEDLAAATGMPVDPMTANIFQDAEINYRLHESGVKLPDGGGVTPDKLGVQHGLPWEAWYQQAMKQSKQSGGQGKPGKGGQGQSGGTCSCEHAKQAAQAGAQAQGAGKQGEPSPLWGDCGSCAGGPPRDYEDGQPSTENPGVTPDRAEVILNRVAEKIASGSNPGKVPGDWQRWAERICKPRVDWRKEVASAIRSALSHTAGAWDYTYSRASRRPFQGVVLPGMHKPEVKVRCLIDSSGSMGSEQLERAASTVLDILQKLGVRDGLEVFVGDTEVHKSGRVFKHADLKPLLQGGGGTDMAECIGQALVKRPKPNVLVVLTDGYTGWPDSAPSGVKTIVGLVVPETQSYPVPSWARKVDCFGEESDDA